MEDISPFVKQVIPLFWTSGDVCPGFQNQGESIAYFLGCVILRFTYGVTPVDCIEVSLFDPNTSRHVHKYW